MTDHYFSADPSVPFAASRSRARSGANGSP